MERFWSKVDRTGECWLWTASRVRGYGRFGVGKRTRFATHVAWYLTHGVWPTLPVLHRCDTPSCVRPDHLYLGTRAQNYADSRARGRHSHGERHGQAKLTESAVREIRQRRGSGELLRVLASEYGVSPVTISDIARRKRWAHL